MPTKSVDFLIQPGGKLTGEIQVPGDKSISHRAIMLGSLAEGITTINGFLAGEDCLATLNAFKELGVKIKNPQSEKVVVHGVGLYGLIAPKKILDFGNSGTSIRLMSGILAGQKFNSVLTGDASLRKRPMARVAKPLMQMGAKLKLREENFPPIEISGNQQLHAIQYPMPVASAQVKSAILLAGLYAKGVTTITEIAPSRDHTERMLIAFGVPVQKNNLQIAIQGGQKLKATEIIIPADISSAAFFIVGACISSNSKIVLKNVGTNPNRLGIINILKLMDADIKISNEKNIENEPFADIEVSSSELHGIEIPKDQVPLAIDEFPALFIAAAAAKGLTILRNAEELRVKESDRIQVMADGLQKLGIDVEVLPDGIKIQGSKIKGGTVNAMGDHRVAMSFAMAGLISEKPIHIEDCANVATSFPNFVDLARKAGLKINEIVGFR